MCGMDDLTKHKADFFVVRLPRMSLEIIRNLPNTDSELFNYLVSWLESPDVQEAIYLASPSLIERLEIWRSKPNSKSGRKVTIALLKYLIRMTCRPTPFGLFSGVAIGKLTDQTNIKPVHLQHDSRKTRLDMFYLCGIQNYYTVSREGQQLLKYLPNPTLYRVGEYLHYIEPYQSSTQRHYRLSSVEADKALQVVLELAEYGKLQHELVQLFCERFEEVAEKDVATFVQQLVQEHVLVADLKLPLTSSQPDLAFLQSLKNSGLQYSAEVLQTVLAELKEFDLSGALPAQYNAIYQKLSSLPYKVSENKLFQTDLYRALSAAQLDKKVRVDIERIILVFKAFESAPGSPFRDFINKFQQRFEGRFMPLLQLLDEETGISFSLNTGYETPLLAGMNLELRKLKNKNRSLSLIEQEVLRAMEKQTQTGLIQLDSNELLKNVDTSLLFHQMPASYAVNVSCYRDKTGEQLLHLHGCYGPSGANLLGRFCHLNDDLQQHVREYLLCEEELSPEVIFAEVVHMPDGRPGNVISRPRLRKYEIVFLADTMSPQEMQIPIQDLYVFIEDNQVKLWSKRLGKQVIPRLTSAHNYSAGSLGVYRFLCMLQHQQNRLPSFSLPSFLQNFEHQPRVQIDNVIVQEAQWLVERTLLQALLVNNQWQASAWQVLEERYRLPRYVCFAVIDNVLTIDLYNPALVNVLLRETINQERVLLKESLAMCFESEVSGDEGRFAHEIIIPMLNSFAKPFVTLHSSPSKQLDICTQRNFPPGSEWLSIKIYAAHSTAELVLSDVIAPLIELGKQRGFFQKWFFIRFGDPDWHLRIRFFGEPKALYGEVLPLIQQSLVTWHESNRVHRTELFSYQREVERYGGDSGIELAEQVFQADSQYVLQTLSLLNQYGESVRWRMAFLGIDAILTNFHYDLEEKLQLISGLRNSFGVEFHENTQLRSQLGKKYRDFKIQLHLDFQGIDHGSDDQPLQQMLLIRDKFLQQLKPIANNIIRLQKQGRLICSLDTLLNSLLHMFNNRIFKAYGREQEFVVYDFLRRYYLSRKFQKEKAFLEDR